MSSVQLRYVECSDGARSNNECTRLNTGHFWLVFIRLPFSPTFPLTTGLSVLSNSKNHISLSYITIYIYVVHHPLIFIYHHYVYICLYKHPRYSYSYVYIYNVRLHFYCGFFCYMLRNAYCVRKMRLNMIDECSAAWSPPPLLYIYLFEYMVHYNRGALLGCFAPSLYSHSVFLRRFIILIYIFIRVFLT